MVVWAAGLGRKTHSFFIANSPEEYVLGVTADTGVRLDPVPRSLKNALWLQPRTRKFPQFSITRA
jgi:hypothetical protein